MILTNHFPWTEIREHSLELCLARFYRKTMKYFTLIFLAFSSSLYSQNHELNINYRYGIPTSTFGVKEVKTYNDFDHRKMQSVGDEGVSVMYKYNIWKRCGLYITGGVEFSKSTHNQSIFYSGSP